MSLSAAALDLMLSKGLTLSDVVEIAKVMEADTAPAPLSPGAMRTRRYRENKAKNVTGDVTVTRNGDDERVSPTPPSEITPIPPLKGGTFPKSEPSQPEKPASAKTKPISAWVDEIWNAAPKPGRERSGKRSVENALRAAIGRKADPAAVKAGIDGYYASPDATKNGGQYAQGIHIVINSGRWEAFQPEAGDVPPTDDDPWPKRLREFRRNGFWNTTDWGPKPGKPGCQAPESLLEIAA